MASAWGSSWGSAWGDSWGAVEGGGGGDPGDILPGVHTVIMTLSFPNGTTLYVYPDGTIRKDNQDFTPPGKPIWMLADQ